MPIYIVYKGLVEYRKLEQKRVFPLLATHIHIDDHSVRIDDHANIQYNANFHCIN